MTALAKHCQLVAETIHRKPEVERKVHYRNVPVGRQIMKHLQGEMTLIEMTKLLNENYVAVNAAFRSLIRLGEVERVSRGVYRRAV